MKQRLCMLTIVTILLGTNACGGPEIRQVTGTVLVDEEPLDNVSVTFWPQSDLTLGSFFCPATDSEGQFVIDPLSEHGQGRAGEYKVLIHEIGIRLPRFPAQFGLEKQTPLKLKLESGVTNLEPMVLPKTKPFLPNT